MRFECGYSGTTESPSWHINGIPFFVTDLLPPYSYYDSSLIIFPVTAALNNSVYNCFFEIHINIKSDDAMLVILSNSGLPHIYTPRHTLLCSSCKDTASSFDITGSSMKITSVISHHTLTTTPIHVSFSDVSKDTASSFDITGSSMKITSVISHHTLTTTPIHVSFSDVSKMTVQFLPISFPKCE